MNKNDLAFPTTRHDNYCNPIGEYSGLTKLEYFAGQAMQGLLSNDRISLHADTLAVTARKQAEALLKELGSEFEE